MCAGAAASMSRWPVEQQRHQPGLQASSFGRADGFPSGLHSSPPVRQASTGYQPFERASTEHMRGPGEPVSFSHATAPSSDFGTGSCGGSSGAGQAGPVDYASMIPDPALRQSFSQNVEEVQLLPLSCTFHLVKLQVQTPRR